MSAMLKFIVRSGAIVFVGVMLGRLAGFVREALIAVNFGASQLADTAVILLTIPDLFINILVGGAVGAALIPEFKRLQPALVQKLYVQSTVGVFLLFLCMALLFVIFKDWLVLALAPGWTRDAVNQAGRLLPAVLWSLPVTAITAVSTALLHARERFAIASLGTLIFNVIIILFLIYPARTPEGMLYALSFGILMAALVRYFSQVSLTVRGGFLKDVLKPPYLITYDIAKKYIQVIIATGFIFAIPIVARLLSSFHEEGSVALTNYAMKLVELPLGVVITVLPIVLFPKLSELFQSQSTQEEAITVASKAIVFIAVISLTIALYLSWFSASYAQILFGWGKAAGGVASSVAVLTSIGVFSLPAQGIFTMTQTVFNAKGDTKSSFYISLLSIILYFPLGWILSIFYALPGLMIAFVTVHWFVLGMAIYMLRRNHGINMLRWFATKETFIMFVFVVIPVLPTVGIQYLLGTSNLYLSLLLLLGGGAISIASGLLSIRTHRARVLTLLRKEKE